MIYPLVPFFMWANITAHRFQSDSGNCWAHALATFIEIKYFNATGNLYRVYAEGLVDNLTNDSDEFCPSNPGVFGTSERCMFKSVGPSGNNIPLEYDRKVHRDLIVLRGPRRLCTSASNATESFECLAEELRNGPVLASYMTGQHSYHMVVIVGYGHVGDLPHAMEYNSKDIMLHTYDSATAGNLYIHIAEYNQENDTYKYKNGGGIFDNLVTANVGRRMPSGVTSNLDIEIYRPINVCNACGRTKEWNTRYNVPFIKGKCIFSTYMEMILYIKTKNRVILENESPDDCGIKYLFAHRYKSLRDIDGEYLEVGPSTVSDVRLEYIRYHAEGSMTDILTKSPLLMKYLGEYVIISDLIPGRCDADAEVVTLSSSKGHRMVKLNDILAEDNPFLYVTV